MSRGAPEQFSIGEEWVQLPHLLPPFFYITPLRRGLRTSRTKNIFTSRPYQCARRLFQREEKSIYSVCGKNFRFKHLNLEELCKKLKFPKTVIVEQNGQSERFLSLLRRLVYPARSHDLENIFGKELSVLSRFLTLR